MRRWRGSRGTEQVCARRWHSPKHEKFATLQLAEHSAAIGRTHEEKHRRVQLAIKSASVSTIGGGAASPHSGSASKAKGKKAEKAALKERQKEERREMAMKPKRTATA